MLCCHGATTDSVGQLDDFRPKRECRKYFARQSEDGRNAAGNRDMNSMKSGKFSYLVACALASSGTGALAETDLLSFEGGGFRAMVADAGLIGAALKGRQLSAKSLLEKVSVISGNSGGTWFTTCLAYSPEFVSGLEKVDGFFDASTGGYMGIVSESYQAYVRKLSGTNNVAVNGLINELAKDRNGPVFLDRPLIMFPG